MTFLAGLLLLLWVVASLLLNGIALLHYFTKLRGLDLVAYGAGAGVAWHALLGWAIAAAPPARWVFVGLLIALTLLSAAYFVVRRLPQEFSLALAKPEKISLSLWGLLLLLSLGLLHIDVRLPEPLPDGMFVFKTRTTNTKVQYLTSLPADNYIPFAVEEFFLRGVSFKENRPILPANEVSNRTILMSLAAMPFRAVLGAPYDHPTLGRYRYLSREWPDVSKLNVNGAFDQFAIVGLVLNSLLLLGLLVFCAGLVPGSLLSLGTLLFVTNPYFIGQTIFTWPKALAGFFILLAWTSIERGHAPIVVAALLALATHCHPYAIVFAGCVGLFYLTRRPPGKWRWSCAGSYLLVFGLILAPWIIWTRFVLHIPSDLIAQNFSGPGTETAWASPIDFLWIRLHNLFYLICSTIFLVYPFDFRAVLNNWQYYLPGVVGLILTYPALAQCTQLPKPRRWLWYGLLGPALFLLAIFSCPALLVLYGYQSLLGVLLFFGVWWLSRQCSRPIYVGLVVLQIVLNLGMIVATGLITGARLW